ncbi:hypothetical protein FRC10_000486 [Ceratobasidium sp. 414]|nr:hypothetical protein FRC10_000486 [Ceratobasidium sp. 414]
MTYLYVPWTAVNSVFDAMGLPAPNASAFPPVNFTSFMEAGDKPNVTVTESEIAMTSKWWDNGVSHSFDYWPVSRGEDGNGWLTVEIVMIRLNQSYTAENSSFQVFGELGANRTRIGFDAAICAEEVKGYVLDAYNNTAGSPISLALQYSGTQLNNSAIPFTQDPSKPSKPPKLIGQPFSGNVQHGISSAGKWAVYNASHYNARNIILKDNGRDWWFVPNPTVVAFGGGMAPTEYTKLNGVNVARVLSNSDSQHLVSFRGLRTLQTGIEADFQMQLPYLVGTRPVVAYVFPDKTVAYTQVYTTWLAVTLAVVLVAGIVVSAFVPRLPLGVSRKDIGVTSWLAAIEDDPSAKAHLSPITGRFGRLRRRVPRSADPNSVIQHPWQKHFLVSDMLRCFLLDSILNVLLVATELSAQCRLLTNVPNTCNSRLVSGEPRNFKANVTTPLLSRLMREYGGDMLLVNAQLDEHVRLIETSGWRQLQMCFHTWLISNVTPPHTTTTASNLVSCIIGSKMRRSNSIRPGGHSRNQSMGGNNTTADLADNTITSYLDETSGHLNDLVQSRTAIGDRDREIARLKDQLASVVNSRPPIEQMKALQKEYQNLELILQGVNVCLRQPIILLMPVAGTQRENERCMTELEKSKRRERLLEAELVKVYGDDWASHVNLPTSSPSISRALPVSYPGNTTVRQSPPPQQQKSEETSDTTINEHIEAVRMLVLGMDAKLAEREAQINKEMARAEEEAQKVASARKKLGV